MEVIWDVRSAEDMASVTGAGLEAPILLLPGAAALEADLLSVASCLSFSLSPYPPLPSMSPLSPPPFYQAPASPPNPNTPPRAPLYRSCLLSTEC
jgi:hypothetical protein